MNNDTGIYSITSPSGKQYIGSTASFKKRWAEHLYRLSRGDHHSRLLQHAWNKYGQSALAFEKIALCPITDLLAVEQRFIDALRPAYNVCQTAGSRVGVIPDEVVRKKLSDAKLGRKRAPHTQEVRNKISSAQKGRSLAPEHRIKLSLAAKTRIVTEEGRKKLSASRLGEKSCKARPIMCKETGAIFPAASLAIRWLAENGHPKAAHSALCRVCGGDQKYAYGYTWKYVE